MPRIVSVGNAVPEYEYDQQEVKKQVRNMFIDKFPGIDRMLGVFDHSNIKKRHFCVPMDWFQQQHNFAEKNALYIKYAVELGARAISDCLESVGLTPADVDKIIFVSSTGIATPSIDALLINKLKFKKHVKRTPVWGLGCAGGVVGLTRAFEYAKAFPESRVLVVTVELCGITFQHKDFTKSNFIATALFGEGAAAALISGDNIKKKNHELEPQFIDTQSTIWEDTLDVMGWEVDETGLKVIFSKDIPSFVTKYIRPSVDKFLEDRDLTLRDIKHFILHPGGMKVIEAYKQALSLPEHAAKNETEVIMEYGNMSSPTVLFVLKRALMERCQAGDYGIITALGPGFSSELILVRWL